MVGRVVGMVEVVGVMWEVGEDFGARRAIVFAEARGSSDRVRNGRASPLMPG